VSTGAALAGAASIAGQVVDYGGFRPVPELIEEQADLHPGRVAVCHAGRMLSYRQLDELANGLAVTAAARGVGKGDRVAVLLVNSLELPVAYLALMKLGAVFVPLDPAWPGDRLSTTLRVLSPRLILTAEADGKVLSADFRRAAAAVDARRITPSPRRPATALLPDDLVYGFFTSGTTGIPKCAMNRQEGLSNRLRFMTGWFAATGDDVVALQNSKHTFDSSLWQLFWPLIIGGRVVLPVQGEFLNLQRTIDTIAEYAITTTDFVSSIFNMLVAIVDGDQQAQRKLASLRYLVVGSEEINAEAVHRFRALFPRVQVANGYGPTETSIGMVFHPVCDADGDKIPLGRPIDNCYVAVTGEDGRVLPRGALGEIAIGGACVGGGYHADPAGTGKVFVSNRLAGQIPGDRLYLSGDLGYLDEGGRLFFAGRKDFQVKINGVRIELGEIELAAHKCAGVRQAKALVAERAGGKALALFASGDHGLTDPALRAHLRATLPRTSVPRYSFVLPAMPLSETGKLDWRELRAMLERALDAEAAGLASAGPAVALPDLVLRALRAALGRGDLDAEANFMDAGGDSLQALLAVRILTEQSALPVSVQDLFDHPTARQLAAVIEGRSAAGGGVTAAGARVAAAGAEASAAGAQGAANGAAGAAAGAEGVAVAAPSAVAETRIAVAEAEAALMERDCAVAEGEPIWAADPAGELRTVLVTGATGFVGSRLAYELLVRTDLRLRCLARAADDVRATERVVGALAARGLWEPRFAGRVEGFAADLARPGLGLDTPTWEHLARTCDLVLHNGALVNLLRDYRSHRQANVLGTAALLRLAMTRRPVPLHYVSTLAVLQRHAKRLSVRLPERYLPARVQQPDTGYARSKWVAERYLGEAKRRGALVTVLRLGEVMPSEHNPCPNELALTHLLLTAISRLGVWPDVTIRSDYTPVDYVAARVVAAVTDRAAWGRTLHVFHPRGVCFAELLARAGAPVTRTSCGDFLARLREAALRPDQCELARLCAALPGLADQDEASLRRALSGLLTDNSALFRRDECRALERRWRLTDGGLRGPIGAYRAYLSAAGPANGAEPPRPGGPVDDAVPPRPVEHAYDAIGGS
jgi:amino acid adenylation domain-containing protein/thioester reductase-like protein